MSRSGYYAFINRERSRRSLENEALVAEIRRIHAESRNTYGSPRIHEALRRQGRFYNRKRIARLMRLNNIVCKMTKKFKAKTWDWETRRCVHKNLLLERKETTKPNQVWVGDMTYIRVNGKWSYLAVVMDLHTRKILGWSYAAKNGADLVSEALLMAIGTKSSTKGIIFHTDQGTEYASKVHRQVICDHGMKPSMSRAGHCWDNASMESFFHTLKTEMIYFHKFKSLHEVASYLMDYITFYNHKRIHSSLNYQTPNEFDKLAA